MMNTPPKRALLFLALVLAAVLFLRRERPPTTPAGHPSSALPTGRGAPAVAVGDNHGVILAPDGSLWTWGGSGFGWQVLGLGSNIRTQACLRRIGRETNWVSVAVGGSTTLALKSDGTLWAWGENLYGQLGDGTLAREQAAPVRSVPGDEWKQVATAGPHSVALKRDGTLWSWGNNWAGQLGDGTTRNSRSPVRVGASTNWTRIWANLIENVGQQADGSLWFWGWDYTRSERGSSIPVPTRVSPDTNWVDVGMGDWMVFALKSDGTLWAWGREANIFTGATNANANYSPLRVGTDTDWRACAPFCQKHPAFLKRDGSLWVVEGSDQPRVTGRGGVTDVTTVVAGWATNSQLHCRAGGSESVRRPGVRYWEETPNHLPTWRRDPGPGVCGKLDREPGRDRGALDDPPGPLWRSAAFCATAPRRRNGWSPMNRGGCAASSYRRTSWPLRPDEVGWASL